MARCKDCVHWDDGKRKTELLKQIYCLKQELILCGSIMERSQCPDKITEMVRDNCLEKIRRIKL